MILDLFNLNGKKAIVTGGAKGLCCGIAKAYHDAGAELVLVDILDLVEQTAKEMNTEKTPVHYVKGDLTDTAHLNDLYQKCLDMLGGRVDILLNGAGIQYRCPAVDFPEDPWRRIIDLNLSSIFFLSQLAGRTMLEQGYGRIINISSMTAFFGSENIPAYTASKGAVSQLTKALSNEWASKNVTVNAIAPGYMATELTAAIKDTNPVQYQEITGRIPMKRWGNPEDLMGAAVFLASDASSYISGITLPVDGGYLGK